MTSRNHESGNWRDLMARMADGEPVAFQQFHDRYRELLVGIANRHIASGLRRRIDGEDIVQSVFRSFHRRASVDEFEFSAENQLRSLVCAITLTKVREKCRFHARQRRTWLREDDFDANTAVRSDTAQSDLIEFEFRDELAQFMSSLDHLSRQIIRLKLEAVTDRDIASQLNVSERTIARLKSRLCSRLQQLVSSQEHS